NQFLCIPRNLGRLICLAFIPSPPSTAAPGAKKYALVLVQKGLTRALFHALYSESTEATPSEEFMIHIHQLLCRIGHLDKRFGVRARISQCLQITLGLLRAQIALLGTYAPTPALTASMPTNAAPANGQSHNTSNSVNLFTAYSGHTGLGFCPQFIGTGYSAGMTNNSVGTASNPYAGAVIAIPNSLNRSLKTVLRTLRLYVVCGAGRMNASILGRSGAIALLIRLLTIVAGLPAPKPYPGHLSPTVSPKSSNTVTNAATSSASTIGPVNQNTLGAQTAGQFASMVNSGTNNCHGSSIGVVLTSASSPMPGLTRTGAENGLIIGSPIVTAVTATASAAAALHRHRLQNATRRSAKTSSVNFLATSAASLLSAPPSLLAIGVRYHSKLIRLVLNTLHCLIKWKNNSTRAVDAGGVAILLDLFLDVHRCDLHGRRIPLQRSSLACLKSLTVSQNNSTRAVDAGGVAILLDLFLDVHRCDLHGRRIPLQRSSLACLKSLTVSRAGRKLFINSGGLHTLFAVCAGYVGPDPFCRIGLGITFSNSKSVSDSGSLLGSRPGKPVGFRRARRAAASHSLLRSSDTSTASATGGSGCSSPQSQKGKVVNCDAPRLPSSTAVSCAPQAIASESLTNLSSSAAGDNGAGVPCRFPSSLNKSEGLVAILSDACLLLRRCCPRSRLPVTGAEGILRCPLPRESSVRTNVDAHSKRDPASSQDADRTVPSDSKCLKDRSFATDCSVLSNVSSAKRDDKRSGRLSPRIKDSVATDKVTRLSSAYCADDNQSDTGVRSESTELITSDLPSPTRRTDTSEVQVSIREPVKRRSVQRKRTLNASRDPALKKPVAKLSPARRPCTRKCKGNKHVPSKLQLPLGSAISSSSGSLPKNCSNGPFNSSRSRSRRLRSRNYKSTQRTARGSDTGVRSESTELITSDLPSPTRRTDTSEVQVSIREPVKRRSVQRKRTLNASRDPALRKPVAKLSPARRPCTRKCKGNKHVPSKLQLPLGSAISSSSGSLPKNCSNGPFNSSRSRSRRLRSRNYKSTQRTARGVDDRAKKTSSNTSQCAALLIPDSVELQHPPTIHSHQLDFPPCGSPAHSHRSPSPVSAATESTPKRRSSEGGESCCYDSPSTYPPPTVSPQRRSPSPVVVLDTVDDEEDDPDDDDDDDGEDDLDEDERNQAVNLSEAQPTDPRSIVADLIKTHGLFFPEWIDIPQEAPEYLAKEQLIPNIEPHVAAWPFINATSPSAAIRDQAASPKDGVKFELKDTSSETETITPFANTYLNHARYTQTLVPLQTIAYPDLLGASYAPYVEPFYNRISDVLSGADSLISSGIGAAEENGLSCQDASESTQSHLGTDSSLEDPPSSVHLQIPSVDTGRKGLSKSLLDHRPNSMKISGGRRSSTGTTSVSQSPRSSASRRISKSTGNLQKLSLVERPPPRLPYSLTGLPHVEILDDVRRLIDPDDLLNRTVFDLDDLILTAMRESTNPQQPQPPQYVEFQPRSNSPRAHQLFPHQPVVKTHGSESDVATVAGTSPSLLANAQSSSSVCASSDPSVYRSPLAASNILSPTPVRCSTSNSQHYSSVCVYGPELELSGSHVDCAMTNEDETQLSVSNVRSGLMSRLSSLISATFLLLSSSRINHFDMEKGHLEFESRFESGNLRKAIQVRQYEYDLILSPDVNTISNLQWFYFRVSNVEADVDYRFNIINCEKPSSQFTSGMQPLLFSVREALDGRCYWRRAGKFINYYRNHFVRTTHGKRVADGNTYHTTTFTIQFPHTGDVCYLAYHYPYTYTRLLADISRWQEQSSSGDRKLYFRVQQLTRTILENPVPVITITELPDNQSGENDSLDQQKRELKSSESPSVQDNAIISDQKPYIFLTARVHSGESNSSWVMQGLIDRLVSSEEKMVQLRRTFIFKIVPMLNPDGVICGKRAKPVVGCRRSFSNLMSGALRIYMYRDISNIVATETWGGLVQHIQLPGNITNERFSSVPGFFHLCVLLGHIRIMLSIREVHSFQISIILIVVCLSHPFSSSHRCSMAGKDLNRRWINPSVDIHPTIYHTKKLLHLLHACERQPYIYIDFHGHSRMKNIFIYGCSPLESWKSPDLHNPTYRSYGRGVEDRSYRHLAEVLDTVAPAFAKRSCLYSVNRAKETAARIAVWREFSVVRSFTIEASYCGVTRNIDAPQLDTPVNSDPLASGHQINPGHLGNFGAQLLDAFLLLPTYDLEHPAPPTSPPPASVDSSISYFPEYPALADSEKAPDVTDEDAVTVERDKQAALDLLSPQSDSSGDSDSTYRPDHRTTATTLLTVSRSHLPPRPTFFAQNTDSAEDLLSDIDMVEKPSESVPVPTLPVSLCAWRILLIGAVFLYSSFTIFVHLCEVDGRLPFLSASVIFLVELLKLLLSLVMFGIHHGSFTFTSTSGTHTSFIDAIRLELRHNLMSSSDASRPPPSPRPPPLTYPQLFRIILPFMIPAVLYAVNNNLGIFIQLEMDPATYQVLGNFKILSTAILFRLIIRRPISPIQWFALFLLLSAGFTHSVYLNYPILPFLSSPLPLTTSYGSLLAKSASPPPGSAVPPASASHRLHITVLGIFLIALYCTISGLSGVTTEYLMKQRAQMNIHLQNALLYTFGIILNGLMFVVEVHRSGDPAYWNPFKGYTLWTWLLILTQSFSGIFMGFVMKYSNNITRLFLISSAMLVTTFTAMLVFGLHLNFLFIASFLLVCISLFLYHR
ncbi:hypothetical protein T265_13549, partial [Opisthorchis viverrini]